MRCSSAFPLFTQARAVDSIALCQAQTDKACKVGLAGCTYLSRPSFRAERLAGPPSLLRSSLDTVRAVTMGYIHRTDGVTNAANGGELPPPSSLSWEAISSSASRELLILWNPMFHCR